MRLFWYYFTPVLCLVARYFFGKKKSGRAITGSSSSSTSTERSDSRPSASDGIGEETSNIVDQQQQHEDPGASISLISRERSDCGPSASVDVMNEEFNIVIDQQQQNNGKSTLRKADDLSASSSSATSIESNNYQVFLSFRGLDTRTRFVDHLYHGLVNAGIRTFRDNDELPQGEDIGPNLLHAIENSKISIPVLSENYASSKWCLQELTHIIKCMESGKQVIFPIFYDVEPADVKYQRGTFGETFSRLTGKYKQEDVDQWTKALRDVASLSGWDSKTTANGHEGKLVKKVVARVWSELKKAFQLDVTEQLVGIDEALEDVLRLLDDNPGATRIVSIHGMGGIGKTTLAKMVYNKLSDQFQHQSFIADIRESSQRNGILSLQNQLICDILNTKDQVFNMDAGVNILKSRCNGKKVLILLDDVDDQNQLKALIRRQDWFKSGSRIIITTRTKNMLNADDDVNCNYELKEIDQDQRLILFSRHAFLKDSPPSGFACLSDKIVSTTGGLPLALEVIGSSLCGKNRSFWQGTLKMLEKVPHDDVQRKLRISYDALNNEEKHIFLDIACFFIGIDVRVPTYMWDKCNFNPVVRIDRLCFNSLIKIGDNHELKMHDQLRDLGKVIASEEVPLERSRLWAHEDYEKALKVLQEDKVNNRKVEALCMDKNGSSKFLKQESFQRLPNLKFLHVSAADSAGDPEISLSELIWLKWDRCPYSFEATNVHLEKLLILELSGGNIRENWGGWNSIKIERLKVLNLSGCSQLKTTPNLSAFKSLEMLTLEDCPNLAAIDPSIGDVKCLVCLNLNVCTKLKGLPDSLTALAKLQHLSLVCCYELKRIPSSTGELGELVELDLSSTGIKELPESIKNLKKLRILRISHSQIKKLPSAIGNLESLQELDASSCRKLGGQILDKIGGLSSLKALRLGKARISLLPEDFHELPTLEDLDLLDCGKLESLPRPPSHLSSLRLTCLSPTLPSLSHLSYLRTLTLHLCMFLESIPQLPSDIQKLRVSECPKLRTMSNLSNLKSLLELELLQCYGLMEFHGLEGLKSLRKLDVSISSELSNCEDPGDLEDWLYQNPQRHDQQADNLQAIPGLGQLISLQVLNISARKHIQQLDLSKSEHLKRLIVNNCESLAEIRFHDKIKFLERFDRDGCKSLEKVPDFSAHNKS